MRKFTFGLTIVLATPVWAQQGAIVTPVDAVPQIVVASHAESKIAPDRATIQIAVQTQAPTAAAAAAENARKQEAVIAALKSLGLTSSQISTTGYNVYPEQRYEPNRTPVITGYNVTNTLLVDVRKLDQVGPVIDAALAKGANSISSLQFVASNTDEARRQAIASAIEKARLDAEAAARSAGGSLGGLLEVNIGAYSAPPPRPVFRAAVTQMAEVAPPTPINPSEETVSVDVTTRWRFVGR
jgi:uncharacterized protein YggE